MSNDNLDQILRDYDNLLSDIEGSLLFNCGTDSRYEPFLNATKIKAKRERLMQYIGVSDVDETDVRTRLLTIIKELSDRDRLLVILRYMEGLRYGEIADILGLSIYQLFELHLEIKTKFIKAFRESEVGSGQSAVGNQETQG